MSNSPSTNSGRVPVSSLTNPRVKAWAEKLGFETLAADQVAFFDALRESTLPHVLSILSTRGRRKGLPLRRAPDWAVEPLRWAAWVGFENAQGRNNESAIMGITMIPEPAKTDALHIWDEVHSHALTFFRRKPYSWASIQYGHGQVR